MNYSNKKLIKAFEIISRPYEAEAGSALVGFELMERVEKIYNMGFEDGLKQGQADAIIQKSNSKGEYDEH